jgi:hypothetical protein
MRESPALRGGREEVKVPDAPIGAVWRVLGVGFRMLRVGGGPAEVEGGLRMEVGVLGWSVVGFSVGLAPSRRWCSMVEQRMCSSRTMCRVAGSRSSLWYLSRRAVNRPLQYAEGWAV